MSGVGSSSPPLGAGDGGRASRAPGLVISVLGGIGLSYGGRDLRLANRKARAMLAYLALSDTGTERRERLAGLFWGDSSEQNARTSLRQVLFELRETLEPLGCQALVAGRQDVGLKPDGFSTDLAAILRELAEGEVPELLFTQSRTAETLMAGYEDLSPLFHDWVVAARRAGHDRLLRLLEGGYEKQSLQRRQRRRMAEAALLLDPVHEAACRTVMRMAAEDGETGAALKSYARLYDVLGDELDMEPSAATQDLLVQIKQGYFDAVSSATDAAAAATPREAGMSAPSRASLSHAGAPIVAVLPFRTIGPDPISSYFAEGMVEDTVCMLATLREPVVISSNSTRRFRDQEVGFDRIGQELGAGYVVSGSIRQAGTRLRLAVELVEAANGAVLWGSTYDADVPQLFDAQEDIAARIARALVPRLRDAELRRSKGQRPEDMTAYHMMLQARDLMFRLEPAPFEQAGKLLQRAVAIDPGYSPTHAALAGWYSVRLGQGWSPDADADTRELEAMARAAISLDSSNGRALAMLAHNRTILRREYDEALDLFDRALGAAPNDAEALMWSSPTFAYIGRADEAVRRAERAIALSPQDPLLFRYEHFLCIGHYANGDYAQAAQWGRRSLRGSPHYVSNLRMTAAALAGLGQLDEARPLVEKVMELQPSFRVGPMIAHQAFRDEGKRQLYGRHLVEAGLPP
jgi:DNA-binding SARP family transcriptional activator/Tfp pilus assembly protein PilF